MALQISMRVTHGADEWLVDSHVATGGFGEIFHATRTKPSPAEAAIKVLNRERKLDPVWVKKFKREARIASQNPADVAAGV